MDREFLERLPFLLPLATVTEVTGLSKHGVRAAVEAGSLRVYRARGSRKGKYYRDEVLELIGAHAKDRIGSHSPDSAGVRPAASTTAGLD